MNDIYLRRRGKVWVPQGSGGVSPAQVASVQKEAERLGFVFDDALVARLHTLSIEALAVFRTSLIDALCAMTGAGRNHRPLYPDFPAQVLAASDAELYLNAVSHYLTLRRPSAEPAARPPLLNGRLPRAIGLGSLPEFELVFTRLAGARTSLSQQDKDDLRWFVREYGPRIFPLLPASVSFKENIALLGAQLATHAPGPQSLQFLRDHCRTATDVLRLAVAFQGGDLSLAEPTRFKSMARSQRRLLLDLLERTGEPTEDMLRWAERWKRLGKALHPGEFAEKFPTAFAAFSTVRNGLPHVSFNGTVEGRLARGEMDGAMATLVTRPGEFARRLDVLLRRSPGAAPVTERFADIADRVSTPVLLQVLSHFKHRHAAAKLRTFIPKGDLAKIFALADERPAVPSPAAASVVAICERALEKRFARLPPLGRCHVDPELASHGVPLAQRSASRALRTLVRGSRLPLPSSPFLRLFLWWKNGSGRTDIDLSAVFYGADFNYLDTVAYYNLKSYGGCHSGDIVDAPQGAAEFIDLDIARLRQAKVRFVVMSLNSYTAQPYCDLPECFAGWMARGDVGSGEVFEPRTVEDRVDLASNTAMCIPLVLDLEAQRLIWADIGLTHQAGWINVKNNLSGVSLMLRALATQAKPDLFTLFTLHGRARGELVDSPAAAQSVFSLKGGVTPFDVDTIRAEFL